jgi:hypothetical protein
MTEYQSGDKYLSERLYAARDEADIALWWAQ